MFLLRRHMSFYLALLAGAVAGAIAWGLMPAQALQIAGIGFFLSYCLLALVAIHQLDADRLERFAGSADAPLIAVYLGTLLAVGVTLAGLFALLNSQPSGWALARGLATVPLSWGTIHLMAALHYAHAYWQKDQGGLAFPQTTRPDGWDFAYFALTIGICAQTADVEITSSAMRKRVMAQAILAFFFNTVLIAIAVNLAITLAR